MPLTLRRLLATPVLLLVLCGVFHAVATLFGDLAFTRAQTEISFWGRGSYQPEAATIESTGNTIAALVGNAPGNPQYLGLQARYWLWRAYWAQDLQERTHNSNKAVASQYRALESRPAHRHSWTKMIEYASRTRSGEAMLSVAQARAGALRPAAPD